MNLRRYIQTTLNPEWYHGHEQKPPFFEGWYFKLIDAATQQRYAIIPGVFLSGEPHAFVQVLNGRTAAAHYYRFPLDDFWAARDRFEIHIGPNRFRSEQIQLQLTGERSFQGTLRFSQLTPWPESWRAPGIMGWYAWVPTMECYHGVVSLDHIIHGALTIDGETVDFSGGRGYTEKDWGKSFPSAWIWMQSNHFNAAPGTSLTASIAMIPWRGAAFRGFIIGLWHEGKLYRFATYTGAETEHLAVDEEQVTWVIRDKTHRLRLVARRGAAETFGPLKGPTTTEMGKRVAESLTADIDVHLHRIEGGREQEIFVGNGRCAGLEVENAEAELLDTG